MSAWGFFSIDSILPYYSWQQKYLKEKTKILASISFA